MLKKEKSLIITLSIIILIALLYVIFTIHKSATYNPPSNIIAEKGVLELSSWDFHKDGYTSLGGQWEFYWQQLLTPKDFATTAPSASYMEMPMAWNKHNKSYISNGYATYSLTIKLNPKYRNTLLSMRVPSMLTSYNLWVNGDLFSSNGIVGTSKSSETPKNLPITSYFMNNSDNIHLVLQVSNHNFRDGGTYDNIYLGTVSQMASKREASIALEVFYFGVLLIMGLYYLYLYTFNLRDHSNLYFGLLCIIISLRVLIVGNTYFLTLYNNLSYSLLLKLEYLTFYATVYFMIGYTYVIFKECCSKKIIKICKLYCIFFIVTTVFISSLLASKILIVFQISTLLIIMYITFVILKVFRSKKQGPLITKVAYLIVVAISTMTILRYLRSSKINDYSLLGFFILMLLNTFKLAMNQSMTYGKIEKLSKEKEHHLLAEKLSEVTFLLNSTLNLQEVLDKLLKSLKELVPYDSASFFMEENGHFNIVVATGFKNLEEIYKVSITKKDDVLFKEIYDTNTTLAVSNVKEDPRFKHYKSVPNIESWLGIPIIFKSKIIGILTLDSTEEHIYTKHHSDIASSFAHHAGIAIGNAKLYGKTKQLASIDPLTNLYNRRSFFELANISFDKAKALLQPISAIMIDIDDFKKINDKLGHHIGDLVLTRLSKVCFDNLSKKDILGRFGGEEFIVLLPNTTFEEAQVIAETLRGAIENNPVIIRKSDSIPITSSLGVASITPVAEHIDLLFVAADKAMYQAKALGKNKVMAINLDKKV
jgi:diguanylate cyclase (GGDEF)-like protein